MGNLETSLNEWLTESHPHHPGYNMSPDMVVLKKDTEFTRVLQDYSSRAEAATPAKPFTLVLDVETTGLVVDHNHIRTVQLFSPGDDQVYVFLVEPWQFNGGGAAWIDALCQLYDSITDNKSAALTAHNANFDLGFLDRLIVSTPLPPNGGGEHHCVYQTLGNPWETPGYGYYHLVTSASLHDTSLAAKLLRPQKSASAKNIAEDMFGWKAKTEQTHLSKYMNAEGYDWATVPIEDPIYLRYAAQDVVLQSAIHQALFSTLRPDPRTASNLWLAYKTELKVDFHYQRCARRGVAVNHEAAKEARDTALKGADNLRRAIVSKYDIANPGSPQQIAAVLADSGYRFKEHTPTGRPRVDKAALTDAAEEGHQIAEDVLEMRATAKLDTWLKPLSSGEVIYPSIITLAARTGRSSMSHPPLQQLPKTDDRIRPLIVPRYPDEVLVSIDYSQIELRVLAAASEDEKLLDAFDDGVDLHTRTAELLNISRPLAKNVNFGVVYGIGADALSKTANVSLIEAERAIYAWNTTFTTAKRWMWEACDTAARKGHVNLWDGRPLPVDEGLSYRAVNYIVQGNASLCLKAGLLEVVEEGYGDNVQFPVHDELLFSFDEDTWDDDAEMCRELMCNTEYEAFCPLVAEITYHGKQWGDPKEEN